MVVSGQSDYCYWQSLLLGILFLPEILIFNLKHFFSNIYDEFESILFAIAVLICRDEPMLEDELPELVPQLRPYQRRAAYWMIQRERGLLISSEKVIDNQFFSPFRVPVTFLDGNSRMFYNPFG